MRNIVLRTQPIALLVLLLVLTLAGCTDPGAPATHADVGAPGIDSIVIERTRVRKPLFLAAWPDTVEKRIGMVVRVFSTASSPTGAFLVHLGTDGGSVVDRDSVAVAVRDSVLHVDARDESRGSTSDRDRGRTIGELWAAGSAGYR